MAREYLRITKEATWGTAVTTPGASTVHIIQLTDSNQFTMRPAPVIWELRSAGGHARRTQRGSSKMVIGGVLNNLVVYASQVPWLAEALTPNASTWVLPSYTVDHVILMEDTAAGSIIGRRYLGVTVSQAQFTASADTQLLRANLTFIGKDYALATGGPPVVFPTPTFSEPAATDYPGYAGDYPVVIEHASSSTLHSANTVASTRTEFDNFQATIAHVLDPTFFNSTRITRLKMCSRNVDCSFTFPYVQDTDRTDFEAVTTPFTASCAFSAGTTPHAVALTFTFNGANYITTLADHLDYNKLFMKGVTFASYADSAVGTDATADFTITGTYA